MNATPSWAPSASILADYYTHNGRLPRQSGADTVVEQKAGNVLRALRRRLAEGDVDADLLAWLNVNVPGWMQENTRVKARGMRGRRSFENQVACVRRFVIRHGHLPSAIGTKDRERELGVFLRNLRQAAQGKGTVAWTDAKARLLNRLVPGWNPSATSPSPVAIAGSSQLAFGH